MELTWRKRLWKMGDTLFHKMTFEEAAAFNVLRLYAGDIPAKPLYENQGFIGLSIKQLICQLRLERAKSLLKSGMDVRTVGQRCGFSSDSYFVQFFKRYTGMSPGKYRDQAAQDEA